MSRKLIVGLDPGTTLAYAALDLHGHVVQVSSKKEFSSSEVIRLLHQLGKVIAIGTDKAKTPGTVDLIARKLGAKVIHPSEDLKVEEKRIFTRTYQTRNTHEGDALASALFAYQTVSPIIAKTDKVLEELHKFALREDTLELVIKQNMAIHNAIAQLEAANFEEIPVETKKPVLEPKPIGAEQFARIREDIKKLIQENKLLRAQNMNLQNRTKKLEIKVENQEIRREKIKLDKNPRDYRESLILQLRQKISEIESQKNSLTSKLYNLSDFVASSTSNIIIKKLGNFGLLEYNKKEKQLKLESGDIIWVEDPNIYSEQVLERAMKMFVYVCYSKKPTAKIFSNRPFLFIPIEEVLVKDYNELFALIDAKKFAEAKENLTHIKKIIVDYQKERSIL
jgi:uncharacterized protein